MLRKFFVFSMFFGFVCGAYADKIPQVVTSEVFYDTETTTTEIANEEYEPYYEEVVETVAEPAPVVKKDVPVWPLAGSDADFAIGCENQKCEEKKAKVVEAEPEVTGVVSKSGTTLIIENNINTKGDGWSGGPNIVRQGVIPAGFDYECANNAEMPLMKREMLEDDGGTVLAVSRSPRKNCVKRADSYAVFAERAGFNNPEEKQEELIGAVAADEEEQKPITEIAVNEYTEQEAPESAPDQVRSWVVVNGQTLHEVLQSWCDKEGWDLVWSTSREYPIEASAVFKGRFVDVASALVRNFERATPIPYAKFYKGNRVIVVSTNEE